MCVCHCVASNAEYGILLKAVDIGTT